MIAHHCDSVLEYAQQKGIDLCFIPPEMISLLQVCGSLCNKDLKNKFKKKYCNWKVSTDPGLVGDTV